MKTVWCDQDFHIAFSVQTNIFFKVQIPFKVVGVFLSINTFFKIQKS